LLENLISRDAVVVNAGRADITGVSATTARCGKLAGFFASDLGIESSIPVFSWDDNDAAVLFADDYAET
jgi:hypothetical protein